MAVRTKRIPKKYKDNFIFDFAGNFDKNTYAQVRLGEYEYFINTDGKCLGKIKSEKLLPIYDGVIKSKGKDGILYEGKLIPQKYDYIYQRFGDYFIVAKNKKKGLIYSQDEIIIEPKYDSLNWITNNLFFAELNKKYGVIDINENIIIPFEYDYLTDGEFFKNKISKLIAKKNGKKGVINIKNKIVIPFEYQALYYITKNTLLAQKSDNEYIFINNKNEQICKKVFEYIHGIYPLFVAKYKGLYGFIDKYGNPKIDFKYTDAAMSYWGYCEVSKSNSENEDNYGCINVRGDLILPFEYERYSIYKINKNRFKVRKNGFDGIVDRNNKKVTDFIFDFIAIENENNFIPAEIQGKQGFINWMNGEPLIIDKKSLKNAQEIAINLSTISKNE